MGSRVLYRKPVFVKHLLIAAIIYVYCYDKFMEENVCVVNRYCKLENKKKDNKNQIERKKRKICY